jgi:hypothetical protein
VSALAPARQHHLTHVSEVIGYLGGVLGHFDPEQTISRRNCELGNAFERGMALPEMMSFPDRYLYNVPIVYDGLILTADRVDTWLDPVCVDEYKLTWSNEGPGSPKFKRFEIQLAAYCLAYKTNRGRVIVGRVNQWNNDISAIEVYNYTFTIEELIENWLQIKGAERAMLDSRRT